MSRIKVIAVAAVAAVTLVTGGGLWAVEHHHTTPKPAANVQQQQTQQQPTTDLTYRGEDGKNALDLLKAHATVVTKDSSYGPYVDSINGTQGGTNGKYWTFFVNGAEASVGAGSYTTKAGDSIEWKLQ